MKNDIALLLVLCLVLTMAGCGGTAPALAETQASTAEAVIPETTAAPTETQPAPPAQPLPTFLDTTTIEPTVLYQQNNVTITAEQLNITSRSVDVELLLENDSSRPLTFICESIGYSCNSVNGYMIEDGYLNCTVDPGKKANDSVSFDIRELMLHGIYEAAELEIGFQISDEDYNKLYTGPLSLRTSAFENHDSAADHYLDSITNARFMEEMGFRVLYASREAISEQGQVPVLSACFLENRDGKQALMLEVRNGTEEMLRISALDLSLNGLKVQSSTHSGLNVNPGKRGILTISPDAALEAEFRTLYGLGSISTLGFRLKASDSDGKTVAESDEIRISVGQEEPAFDDTGSEIWNQDGLRILVKGIAEDPSEYSKNQHVLLLAVNASDHPVRIDDVYDSVSVNGFMTDYYFHGQQLLPGQSGVIGIELTESSLEKNKLTAITDLEIRLTTGQDQEIPVKMVF